MSDKMDRQGARTPADLERKYQFGKRFAEIMGVALDAQKAITVVESELQAQIVEQYTSIMRDTEKIILEAAAKYVKETEYAEYKNAVSAQFKVMADEISAKLLSTTEQLASLSDAINSVDEKTSAAVANVENDIRGLNDALGDYSMGSEEFRNTVTDELSNAVERIKAAEDGITETDAKVDGVDEDLQTVKGEIELHYEANAEFEKKCEAEISATSEQVSLNMSSTERTFSEVYATFEDAYGNILEQKEFSEEVKKYCDSEIAASAEEFGIKFQSNTDQITNVNGDIQKISEDLQKHFEFSVNGLTIKSAEGQFKLRLDNGMISFYKGEIDENDLAKNRFGWWDGINFYTGNIFVDVEERAQFGNFAFVPRSNGSLDFLKVGG